MLKTFTDSFRLRNTYRVNSIVYSIKQFPVLKKILSDSLYKSRPLKVFACILSVLAEIAGTFLGKAIYILLMILWPMVTFYQDADTAYLFVHLFILLTICGGIVNNSLFNTGKDRYYAIVLMKIDAKKFTLSNYYYFLLKMLVGFMPFTIIFGLRANVPLMICVLMPFFVVMCKLIFGNVILCRYKKNRTVAQINVIGKPTYFVVAALLILAYILPLKGIMADSIIFMAVFLVSCVLGVYSFCKINSFGEYRKAYRSILLENTELSTDTTKGQVEKMQSLKQIAYDPQNTSVASKKTGYRFLHEIFVKRHRKLLMRRAKIQTWIILIILAVFIVVMLLNDEFKKSMNEVPLMYLPYFTFIMYMLNAGQSVTQAMFMNCDHSMLAYKVYRKPDVILGLFKERLKTLIVINLCPAVIIAVGLPLVLYISGGTSDYINYIILFVTIIAMSIFFSVHYMVMYYLLQPYNVNTEAKSSTYSFVKSATYFVCYMLMLQHFPTLIFGGIVTAFCVLYCIIALILAYKKAPYTFKLRN